MLAAAARRVHCRFCMESKMTDDRATRIALVIYDTIKEFGPSGVPSGQLYAMLSSALEGLDAYEDVIDVLVYVGLVRREAQHHLVAV